jgi:hypothetical protein
MLFCDQVERVPNFLYFLTKETVETECLKHSAAVKYHGRKISCNRHVQVPSITTNQVNKHCFVVNSRRVHSVNRMKHTKTLCGEKAEVCSFK